MQHIVVVDKPHGVQQLFGNGDDFLLAKLMAFALDHFLKIKSINEVNRHVSSEIVFKNLVNGDDVRVNDLGEIAGFAHEKLDDRTQFGGMRTRPSGHDGVAIGSLDAL